MQNRKKLGLIPYSAKVYTSKRIKLFQGGGTITSVAEKYDWKDDPYEKMLIKNKLEEDKAKLAYSAAKTKADATAKKARETKAKEQREMAYEDDFSLYELQGGFEGSRARYNKLFKGLQDIYYESIKSAGVNASAWARSSAGKEMYRTIVAKGIEFQNALKLEDEFYTTAKGSMESGKTEQTLAISGTGLHDADMFVSKAYKDKLGNIHDVYEEIKVTDYIANLAKPNTDKTKQGYNTVTMSELLEWKKTKDVSGTDGLGLMKKYAIDGAMNLEEFYKESLEGMLKNVGVDITVSGKSAKVNGETMDLQKFKNDIATRIMGGGAESIVATKVESNTKALEKKIEEIFTKTDIVTNNPRTLSTLLGSALRSQEVAKGLQDITANKGTATSKQLATKLNNYVTTQAQTSLIDRMLLNGITKTEPEEISDGGPDKLSLEIGKLQASLLSMYSAQGQSETFPMSSVVHVDGDGKVYENGKQPKTGTQSITSTYNAVRTPLLGSVDVGGISKKTDGTIVNPESITASKRTVANNESLNKIGYTSKAVMAKDGRSIDVGFGMANSKSELVIAPGSDIDMEFIPVVNGKIDPGYYTTPEFVTLQLEAREAFIEYKLANGTEVEKVSYSRIKPNSLMQGYNLSRLSGTSVNDATSDYSKWVISGKSNIVEGKKTILDAITDKKSKEYINALTSYNSSVAASKAIKALTSGVTEITTKKPVQILPFAAVQVNYYTPGYAYDADDEKLAEQGGERLPSTTSIDNEIGDDGDGKMDQEIRNADGATTKILVPLSSSYNYTKNTMKEALKSQSITDKIIKFTGSRGISTNNITEENVIKFAIQ